MSIPITVKSLYQRTRIFYGVIMPMSSTQRMQPMDMLESKVLAWVTNSQWKSSLRNGITHKQKMSLINRRSSLPLVLASYQLWMELLAPILKWSRLSILLECPTPSLKPLELSCITHSATATSKSSERSFQKLPWQTLSWRRTQPCKKLTELYVTVLSMCAQVCKHSMYILGVCVLANNEV